MGRQKKQNKMVCNRILSLRNRQPPSLIREGLSTQSMWRFLSVFWAGCQAPMPTLLQWCVHSSATQPCPSTFIEEILGDTWRRHLSSTLLPNHTHIPQFLYTNSGLATYWPDVFYFFLIKKKKPKLLFLAALGLHFARRAFSSCGKQRLIFSCGVQASRVVASVIEQRLQVCGLRSCGIWAQVPSGMCDLPRQGTEPASSVLQVRFFTTGPQGKPPIDFLILLCPSSLMCNCIITVALSQGCSEGLMSSYKCKTYLGSGI